MVHAMRTYSAEGLGVMLDEAKRWIRLPQEKRPKHPLDLTDHAREAAETARVDREAQRDIAAAKRAAGETPTVPPAQAHEAPGKTTKRKERPA